MNTLSRYAGSVLILLLAPLVCVQAADSATPVKIIYDTDLAGDWDDVGATAALLALEKNGEAEVLGMGVSAGGYAGKWSPLCLNAIATYYGRPEIPIGVVREEIGNSDSPYAKEIAENWPHPMQTKDIWDATELYRKILSEQPDNSVVFVSVGYLTNMAEILRSNADKYSDLDGIALVKQKVKRWVCMGGRFPEGWESNLASAADDTKFAIENWPTPILFSGIQIGSAISSGRGLVRTSYKNPIRAAYEICCGQIGCQHANWDQTAVVAAIRDPELYWDIVTGGSCTISGKDAKIAWHATPNKGHSYLVNRDNANEVSEVIDGLMTDVPFPFSDKEQLVMNLKFDEDHGDVAPDASGTGHPGIFTGKHSWVPGKYGNAACFGEDSGTMMVSELKAFNIYKPKKFTVAFWVYLPDSVPSGERVWIKRRVDRGQWMTVFKSAGENKICLKIKETSITSKSPVTPDTWHHIAITMAKEKASFYLDGELDNEQRFHVPPHWMLSNAGLRLGANVDGEEQSTTYFDDLFLLKDVVSEEGVQELMGAAR